MNPELKTRIEAKETWTFRECVGLASEFNLKPRYVIGFVLSLGKNYVDTESEDDDHSNTNK